jgi:hypothetical protein
MSTNDPIFDSHFLDYNKHSSNVSNSKIATNVVLQKTCTPKDITFNTTNDNKFD